MFLLINAKKKQISATSTLNPLYHVGQTSLARRHPFPAFQMQSKSRFIDFLDLIYVYQE
jgi:hypothetical protein